VSERSAWIAGLAAGLLVWIAAPELHWPARLLAALLLGPAPVASLIQARMMDTLPQPLPRSPIYFGSIFVLWTLGAVSFAAATASGFPLRSLGIQPVTAADFAIWAAIVVVAGGTIVAACRALGMRESPVMHDLIPVTPREKAIFALLCVSAGICEEVAFRGFLLAALTAATGSLFAGVVVSSVAFGVLHAHQNPGGAARAAVLGAVLAIPLLVTGSLLPSIVGHALIDLVGGLLLHRWLLRS